jgi:hypothetical protein
MKTCPDCGCRVYSLGCTNCNEEAYIEQQAMFDELPEEYAARKDDDPPKFSEIAPRRHHE